MRLHCTVPAVIGIGLVLLVTVSLAGCVGFRGPEDVRADLERTTGVGLEKESALSVGPIGLLIAGIVVPADAVPFDIGDLSSVEVGTYRVCERDGERCFDLFAVDLPEWERIARMRDEGEQMLILVDGDESSLRKLLLLTLDGDELMVARAKGRLDRVLDELLAHEISDEDPLVSAGSDPSADAAPVVH